MLPVDGGALGDREVRLEAFELPERSLSAGYGAATVVRDAALEVGDGELVAVLGANGAGKTTLLRALSGLIRPMAGEVRFLGWRIDQLAGDRIAREGLILVPEGRQVFPDLSVIDNLRLGAYARGSAGEARRIEALLERFAALEARRHQRAGLLSGGEQQMLAIARGLMARPEVLMLDEPSLGLAPKLLEVLYDLLAELRRRNDDPARRPDGDDVADRDRAIGHGERIIGRARIGNNLMLPPHHFPRSNRFAAAGARSADFRCFETCRGDAAATLPAIAACARRRSVSSLASSVLASAAIRARHDSCNSTTRRNLVPGTSSINGPSPRRSSS